MFGSPVPSECLALRAQADTKHQFGGEPYLNFERLTLVPLQRKMLDLEVPHSLHVFTLPISDLTRFTPASVML